MSPRVTALAGLLAASAAFAGPAAPVLRVETPAAPRPAPPAAAGPLRVAEVTALAADSESHGAWRPQPDGGWAWELIVELPGAAAAAVALDASALPVDAALQHGATRESLRPAPPGAVAAGRRWLPLVPGDRVLLRLVLPAGRDPAEARLQLVDAAASSNWRGGASLSAGDCQVDVACAAGDPWREPIRSVARYTYQSGLSLYLCTGQLVMDAEESFRPWFLTARHCGVAADSDDGVVVYWNFEASTCGGPRDGPLDDTQVGAALRFEDAPSDTQLLELLVDPPAAYGVHHSGWDRSDAAVSGVAGIHHPAGDEKSISLSDRALFGSFNCIEPRFSGTHWWVPGWDLGVTEPGSSGSGIWDHAQRLVGVLSGGNSTCDSPDAYDCYGRFAVAWANGLDEWLDPRGDAPLTVDGADPPVACEGPDSDGDGRPDACDACPSVPDPGQEDRDGDGVGDACDGCVRHPDPEQADADGDGVTEGCEFDYGDLAPAGAPDGRLDVADVLRVLRAAVDLEELEPAAFEAANVAPAELSGSAPEIAEPTAEPPRVLDVADVLLVLRAAVGLAAFTAPS